MDFNLLYKEMFSKWDQTKIRSKQLASELLPYITGVRRHIHRFPRIELWRIWNGCLHQIIVARKRHTFTDGWVKTGIVATVAGSQPGPTRCFRAELDALPIEEKTIISLINRRSRVNACLRHDVHAAALLGACIIAHSCKEHISGTLLFIFQPGEENCLAEHPYAGWKSIGWNFTHVHHSTTCFSGIARGPCRCQSRQIHGIVRWDLHPH